MAKIFQIVYFEGDKKHIEWCENKKELEEKIKHWEEEGFGVADDVINEISFTNIKELTEQLNNLEEKK
tara:strand:- start:261 stop:464 length:204 start_codon:yes stop_codon:yes gene_type:complete